METRVKRIKLKNYQKKKNNPGLLLSTAEAPCASKGSAGAQQTDSIKEKKKENSDLKIKMAGNKWREM